MRPAVCFAACLMAMPGFGQQGAGSNQSVVQIPAASHLSTQRLQSYSRSPYFDDPPTFELVPSSAQAHTGKVWVRAADNGLLILARIDAPEQGFRWPEQKSQMLGSDHVEVWLASSADVPMPAVGWGNQFGQSTLKSAADCTNAAEGMLGPGSSETSEEHCRRWYGEQMQYRQDLRRLFVRQWLVAGSGGIMGGQFWPRNAFEAFASAAWSDLAANFFERDLPKALRPREDDGVIAAFNDLVRRGATEQSVVRTGYELYMVIPYSAFPPVAKTDLKDVYLAVDVYSAAPEGRKMGAVSSTAPGHAWGPPQTFNHVQLAEPQHYSISPCEARPAMTDMYGSEHAAWFYPVDRTKSDVVDSVIALINPAGGYMYEPGGVSPQADTKHYFWKTLPGGGVVCGPDLAYRKGATVTRSDNEVQDKYFDARTLPDGWTLVRDGPVMATHSAFGSGQCGACPEVGFHMYAISPEGRITTALEIDQDLSGNEGVPSAADLMVSDDWSHVTLFLDSEDDGNPAKMKDTWQTREYCLNKDLHARDDVTALQHAQVHESYAYKACGTRQSVTPPTPPHYPEMRADQ